MAVQDSMFLFEVVVESVKNLVDEHPMVVRAEFSDVFSLDLKDPKQLDIVIPEPLPEPPAPPGKKGKPKPAGKKGKGPPPPPPEPVFQSGQSILFASSPEVLIADMEKYPLEISVWSKHKEASHMGMTKVAWGKKYFDFLYKISECGHPDPVSEHDTYLIFEENTAKRIADVKIEVKLRHLGDKVITTFRTIGSSMDGTKSLLYTGANNKQMSFICRMKPKESVHVVKTFKVDKPMELADYRNAAPIPMQLPREDQNNCIRTEGPKAPPDPTAPSTMPSIDFMIDYVRRIITSCSQNLRMLTPRPTIRPRIKATDLDRICMCRRDDWPEGPLAERMQQQQPICPLCAKNGETQRGSGGTGSGGHTGTNFDITNLRGPCGRNDCKLARKLREYILQLLEEDNKEITLDDIVGPCGSKACDVATKIQEFIRKEGAFKHGGTKPGLLTQCGCEDLFQKALNKEGPECDVDCQGECARDYELCCQCNEKSNIQTSYVVNYFTVHYDKDNADTPPRSGSYPHCNDDCPSKKESKKVVCTNEQCLEDDQEFVPCSCDDRPCEVCSPNDSNIEINIDDIRNPCCVETCDAADKVKEFLIEGVLKKQPQEEDPCYCDCDCKFTFGRKTTYCPICGGYEVAGDDMTENVTPYTMTPQPCPIYHKIYDKNNLKIVPALTPSASASKQSISSKTSKTSKINKIADRQSVTILKDPDGASKTGQRFKSKKPEAKPKKPKPDMKLVDNLGLNPPISGIKKKIGRHRQRQKRVKAKMGWAWKSKSVPALPFRPEWKPGAANKGVVNKLRKQMMGQADDSNRKKKKKVVKKSEIQQLIKIQKTNGEYTVTLQNMKQYAKQRRPNQYPFDKNPQEFFIGRSAAHNASRQKKQERLQRRKERAQRAYIMQSFRNMCDDICLKTYQQAVGIVGNDDNPDCPCFPAKPDIVVGLAPDGNADDSCSCSESETSDDSDTDNDEWTVTFSPPIAKYDPKHDVPNIVFAEKTTQYNYLDYRVKCLDTTGNQVQRHATLPDGRVVCTDLGGFWGPGKKQWFVINEDGWIGPDNRWCPRKFVFPTGEVIEPENGKFQVGNKNYVCGVDGYVDSKNHWVFYAGKSPGDSSVMVAGGSGGKAFKKGGGDTSWSCFGDASAAHLASAGIVGHGADKQTLATKIHELIAKGANLKMPTIPKIPKAPRSRASSKKSSKRSSCSSKRRKKRFSFKCKHAKPSPKGVLASDGLGNKVYFTMFDYPNRRSAERIKTLSDRGIDLSTYHVPCFSSFISCETMKREMRERCAQQHL